MSATSQNDVEPVARTGVFRQVRELLGALRVSPVGKTLVALMSGIVVVIALTAYGQLELNSWNKPFYDAISRRDLSDFIVQVGVFAVIAGVLLVLNVAQRWLGETLQLKLRDAVVNDLVGLWLHPRRAFWLQASGPMGAHPDQRMHEDTLKLCDLSVALGVGLLQATILFGSFASVLWVLSKDFSIFYDGQDHVLPGFMLWAAIVYAVVGSLMTYWVGNGLILRNAERYAREGELRFSLTRINEHLDGISLAGGEADEKRRVAMHFGDVLRATSRVVLGLTNLTWVTAGFGWVTIIAPTLVAAPLYFSGKVSFGGLMMAAAAFTQAQSSLRWFVDNFSIIADWRATLLRVADLRQMLASDLEAQAGGSRIAYEESEAGTLSIEALEVRAWTGHDRLDAPDLVVHPGQRLLILGTPGTEKTLLFRALAGLWPWGSGTVRRPRGEAIHYMPRGTPYLPRGTLAEVLSYAMEPSSYPREAMVAALASVGLQRLEELLNKTGRWERELSMDEQLRLGFARVVLQAPAWLVMDDAFGAFDDDTLELIIDVLDKLAHTGIVHIGSAGQAHDRLFTQVVHLVKAPTAVPEEQRP
ncbi:ABC transporter ATP-binding protein/permease [Variovorax sp. J22P240]|uniref:ABC transporter ATP-binding protein/permease n=1 Tax=unclassified Variovorax TaxID=663243 RepID=UPI002577ACE1|nr:MULTISPECIES: ABC transporter ATP-binding protein/permease [unclassified Variovorax]MDM0002635.1 ABC transporter ATP-binding protein/permease [Variovorax sp. J22P240]MDM0047594.1 ABC transporter ATP-binding protein/permease [Variovorax sp. J22R115]